MSKGGKMLVLQNREQLLQRLADVVGAYGADQTRWPQADRQLLRVLLVTDWQAQQLLSEAALMDQLLDFADQYDEPHAEGYADAMGRLSDRIMSKLDQEDAQTRARASTGKVILFPGHKTAVSGLDNKKNGRVSSWGLQAALAASLMLGIFVGATGYLEQATNSVTALAGLNLDLDTGTLIDDGFGSPEEEFL